MAMGQRERDDQGSFWVATSALPTGAAHPFYEQVNRILDSRGFDGFVEGRCRRFYADTMGRPSLAPAVYFRIMMVGYFEGIDSERGIAWRVSDSLGLRKFLGYSLTDDPPDHSTISRNRRLIDVQTHEAVFTWVLQVLAEEGLLKGKTVGIDATTLEANAAMRSIVRHDTGESYQEFLTRLAKASGMETPTREDLAKLDKHRENKASNEDWQNPHDPDAKVTKMKDGRTHLAYKAEQVVDLKTEMVVAAQIYPADQGDAETLVETLAAAQENLREAKSAQNVNEVVADKGYHKAETLADCAETMTRTYIAEAKGKRRRWTDKPEGQQEAVYANRRRCRGERGKRLQRWRSERIERSFAHVCETGGARRTWIRGLWEVTKRYLIQVAAHNLGLIMRRLFGVGTPRSLQGSLRAFFVLWRILCGSLEAHILLLIHPRPASAAEPAHSCSEAAKLAAA